MRQHFVAKCNQCNTKEEMCTSCGGVKKFSKARNVETSRYDLHTKLVKATLLSNGYHGVLDLCANFKIHPLSEKTYFEIAREIEDSTIDKLEKVMEKTRAELHDRLRESGDENKVKEVTVSCDAS